MTHSDLCRLALKWLKRPNSAGGPGCAVAVSECRTGWNGEIPDAIGFRATEPNSGSVVIEVKTSRSDFLADSKKPHRAAGGVGDWRYYMAPEGMIATNELPQGWGLLEVNGRGHIKARTGHAVYFKGGHHELCRQGVLWKFHGVDIQREQFLLVRVMANTGDPQKTLDRLREANNINARLSQDLERARERYETLRLEMLGARREALQPIARRVA